MYRKLGFVIIIKKKKIKKTCSTLLTFAPCGFILNSTKGKKRKQQRRSEMTTFESYLENYTTALRDAEEEGRLDEIRNILYQNWWDHYGRPQQEREELIARQQMMLRTALNLIGKEGAKELAIPEKRQNGVFNGTNNLTESDMDELENIVAIYAPNQYEEWLNQ